MVELSAAVEGQLLIYMFQYLQMSDLWVASYTVHHILPVHYAASEHTIQYNYLCCLTGDGPQESETVEYTGIMLLYYNKCYLGYCPLCEVYLIYTVFWKLVLLLS
jgi:hypothetical protein